ncbi:hypothetical protein C1H46_010647 [Malus baccata]|uniref:Uncharacterized protein n=1 Tax=Malus baccata TaxID=106549 RepID=A0A540MZJ4_MALBA|nr:hypothetical protein C1H46_010647 [Malus baccata]
MNIRLIAIVCCSLPVVGTLVRLFFSSLQDTLSTSADNGKYETKDQNIVVASDPSNVTEDQSVFLASDRSNATAQMHFRQLQHIRTA